MAYLGREPVNGYYQKQSITTDGSTTTFTLDYTVGTVNSILVQVDGVLQEPTSSYTIASGGTQIVFSEAPLSTDTTFVIYLGIGFDTAIIGDASFTHTELAERAASNDKFLIYDTSASAVKTIQTSNIVASTVQRDYTGDGSDTTFTVTSGVTADNILVIVEGLVMLPATDYSVSGTTLTFTTAPSVGDKIDIRELPA
tara:strand:+ start:662 stop:1255 length:594 start_codon:yes stop_codon:yes gene_type:complete